MRVPNICWYGSVCECLCVCVCACVCVRAHHLSTRLAKLITSTCGTHNKLSSAPLPRSGSPHPPASSSEHRVEVELELVYMNVDVIGAVSGLVADVANAKGISSGSTRASISMYRTSGHSGNRRKGDMYCGTPWYWRLKRRILLLKAFGVPHPSAERAPVRSREFPFCILCEPIIIPNANRNGICTSHSTRRSQM